MSTTLFDWLIHAFPDAKRQTLRRMVAGGRVTINGRPADNVKEAVNPDDTVQVGKRPPPGQSQVKPLRILHEDLDVLVVYKPAGLLTSTVPGETRPTAIAIIRQYLADSDPVARPGIIHRLDRDAQGILVFSRNNGAYESLKQQFFVHSVDRVYTAVVHGVPEPRRGRIETRLMEREDGQVVPSQDPGKGEEAVTEYEVLREKAGLALLKVVLHTGRKHQIRAHLAARGHPIVGDPVYGVPHERKRTIGDGGRDAVLLLAATSLSFDHPRTGVRLTFSCPPPRPIRALFPDSGIGSTVAERGLGH